MLKNSILKAVRLSQGRGWLARICIGFFTLVVSGHLISCLDSDARRSVADTGTSADASSSAPERRIPYRVIKEWNGGNGKVIVIAPAYRNEKDMRTLGDNLRYDTRNSRFAYIEVYDDEKAAGMRDEAFEERLSKKNLAYHDKHLIGRYTRNMNTGFHQLQIMANGIKGQWIEVNY